MKNHYTILLTGTITPSPHAKTVISQPAERLHQYCEGILFWSRLPLQRNTIIFFDNSGYGTERISDQLSKMGGSDFSAIEIYSHFMNDYPKDLHYGYAELTIIDHALTNISSLKNSQYFIKATGRLTFPNVVNLLNKLPDDFHFAVDSRKNSLFVKHPQLFVTTQLMIFNTQFYQQNLIGIQQELSAQNNLIENLFYEKLTAFEKDPKAILRWPVSVDPVGTAAHWQKDYSRGFRRFALNKTRSLLRRIAPFWWV
ncbi:MAG: hypothetical protein F9K32_14945 [Desulfobulbaceae bacterium]|nr:MAG: hypothetical protein F9K32_14945 [Desulfobulbaceae bacterium]